MSAPASRPLLLASSSPRRREIMTRFGLPFDVVAPSGVDESDAAGAAFDLCQTLAARKAEWVATHHEAGKSSLVIGADTVVALVQGGCERIIGKPRDADHAREILRSLAGKTHRVITGIAVALPGEPTRVEAEVTLVSFRKLSADDVERYIATGDAEGKAGAYGIQSAGGGLVESIRGCYLNVVGLPLALLARMIGVELSAPCGCERHALQKGQVGCRLAAPPNPRPRSDR